MMWLKIGSLIYISGLIFVSILIKNFVEKELFLPFLNCMYWGIKMLSYIVQYGCLQIVHDVNWVSCMWKLDDFKLEVLGWEYDIGAYWIFLWFSNDELFVWNLVWQYWVNFLVYLK